MRERDPCGTRGNVRKGFHHAERDAYCTRGKDRLSVLNPEC